MDINPMDFVLGHLQPKALSYLMSLVHGRSQGALTYLATVAVSIQIRMETHSQ
jgi:hypothetical protein